MTSPSNTMLNNADGPEVEASLSRIDAKSKTIMVGRARTLLWHGAIATTRRTFVGGREGLLAAAATRQRERHHGERDGERCGEG